MGRKNKGIWVNERADQLVNGVYKKIKGIGHVSPLERREVCHWEVRRRIKLIRAERRTQHLQEQTGTESVHHYLKLRSNKEADNWIHLTQDVDRKVQTGDTCLKFRRVGRWGREFLRKLTGDTAGTFEDLVEHITGTTDPIIGAARREIYGTSTDPISLAGLMENKGKWYRYLNVLCYGLREEDLICEDHTATASSN